jgi:hypothetical protein
MDKKVNKTIENYIIRFKDDIKNKLTLLNFEEKNKTTDILEMIYDYEFLTFSKDDFTKKKRDKQVIPEINRCIANRANGEQCSRRKQMGYQYCGTHTKGTPYGVIQYQDQLSNQKIEVIAEEINGIVYYVDKFNNVYKTDDILNNLINPEVIAKYVKIHNGKLSIPEFGLV